MFLGLKMAILERFRTQADFAVEVGMHESAVSKVVHGRKKLDEKQLVIWSRVLQLKPKLLQKLAK